MPWHTPSLPSANHNAEAPLAPEPVTIPSSESFPDHPNQLYAAADDHLVHTWPSTAAIIRRNRTMNGCQASMPHYFTVSCRRTQRTPPQHRGMDAKWLVRHMAGPHPARHPRRLPSDHQRAWGDRQPYHEHLTPTLNSRHPQNGCISTVELPCSKRWWSHATAPCASTQPHRAQSMMLPHPPPRKPTLICAVAPSL